MKMRLFVVAFLVMWGASTGANLYACGAKFLMANRGTRFGRVAVARYSAAVLVYANPGSTLPEALRRFKVDEVLGKAGYRPTIVSSQEDVEQALTQGGWDLMIADLADGETLRTQLEGDSAPVFVPVMLDPSKSEFEQAEEDFGIVVKGGVKSQKFLETIDEVTALLIEHRAESEVAD